MNYKEYNDFELVSYIQEHNEDAINILYEKYTPVIQKLANKWYLQAQNLGVEKNDLVQEGMVGLSKAIDRFQESKDASFYTFAIKCIESRMKDFITTANRLKHRILNESISLEIENEDGTFHLSDMLQVENNDPAYLLLNHEEEERLIAKLNKVMTSKEQEVFKLKYQGFSMKEIQNNLKWEYKVIDNAMQRIRLKFKKILTEEE